MSKKKHSDKKLSPKQPMGSGTDFAAVEQPLVGVVSSSLGLLATQTPYAELLRSLEQGVAAGGGKPFLFGVPGASRPLAVHQQATRYDLPIRELVADLTECVVRMHGLDGIVFLSDSESSIAGMLMGVARLNIPAVIVPFDLEGPYVQHILGVLTQALGMSIGPCGSSQMPMSEKRRTAFEAGQTIVHAIRNNLVARRIMTQNAFHNAITVDMALGGTTQAALQLMAIAYEAGVTLPLLTFDEIAHKTPQLCSFDGTGHTLKDLIRAGGILGVMAALKAHMKPSLSVTGKSLEDLLSHATIDKTIIKAAQPYRKEASLAILFGNLAPSGCIVRTGLEKVTAESVEGPARVFNSEEEALQAIAEKRIKPKEILVIRYEGPKGGPGMREMTLLTKALKEYSKGRWAAVVTDGRLSEEMVGICATQVSPEAAEGGTLAIVRDGDILQLDLKNRQLNVRLTNMEIKVRLARWQSPSPQISTGVLSRYARDVMPAESGAVLK